VQDIDRQKAIEKAQEDRIIELAEKKVERAEADTKVQQASIAAEEAVEASNVAREQVLDAARLERQRAMEQLEVARLQALREAEIAYREEVERAEIATERGLDEARISRDKERRKLDVQREREVEIEEMDKAIALYSKSLEQSAAHAAAEEARAKATEAEELVQTVRDSEAAKRRRTVEVMMAEKEAEETKIAAAATKVRAAVEAEAQRLLNEAENVLTDEARYSLFRRKLLEHVEGIVRESVKPMEKIDGINILQVDGIGGGGGGNRNTTDEIIDSALRYRVQAPMVDNILSEIGIEGGSLSKMGGLIREARDLESIRKDTERKSEGSDSTPEGGGDGGSKK
jgi:uncharacterized membrane protein YqiK